MALIVFVVSLVRTMAVFIFSGFYSREMFYFVGESYHLQFSFESFGSILRFLPKFKNQRTSCGWNVIWFSDFQISSTYGTFLRDLVLHEFIWNFSDTLSIGVEGACCVPIQTSKLSFQIDYNMVEGLSKKYHLKNSSSCQWCELKPKWPKTKTRKKLFWFWFQLRIYICIVSISLTKSKIHIDENVVDEWWYSKTLFNYSNKFIKSSGKWNDEKCLKMIPIWIKTITRTKTRENQKNSKNQIQYWDQNQYFFWLELLLVMLLAEIMK